MFIVLTITASSLVAAYESFRRLLHPQDISHIWWVAAAGLVGFAGTEGATAVEQVRVRWIGHELHAEAAITSDASMSLIDAHRIARDAEHELLHKVPRLSSALIHTSPAGESSGHDAVAIGGLWIRWPRHA